MNKLPFALLATAPLWTGCTIPPPPDTGVAHELAVWMTGTFSSHAQNLQKPQHYLSIRLVMLPIWTDRDDGPWLYVEQAADSALSRPYRQRVYHLVATGPDSVRSDVYALPDQPLNWSGAWRKDVPLGDLDVEDITLLPGCSIHLQREGTGRFAGATDGASCHNHWGGASYATSEVTIVPDTLTSWDRGYNEDGEQVWGAEHGAYIFDKVGGPHPD